MEFAALPTSTTELIAEYERENLYPLYDKFEENAQTVISYVRNTQQNIFTSADALSKSTLAWSVVIIAAMTVGLFFFQFTIRKMSRRLYDKNKQFELLSDTVDETFLIFKENVLSCEFVSGSAERVLGLSSEALTENRKLFYHQLNAEASEKLMEELHSEANDKLDKTIEYRHPLFAESRWLHLRSYRLEQNGERRFIISLSDRTEERLPLDERALEALKVLVADDERDICEHTALLLEKMKISAEWVLGGKEAVEKVVQAKELGRQFDVCLIDWKMPDMDGLETTRRIRAQVGPDTPIIIITAYDWSEIEEEARKAGVNGFISKPLFQSSLYNTLVAVTNGAYGKTRPSQLVVEASLGGKRLLLAEDNSLNMEIAVTMLKMNGAKVETAVDGRVAVDRYLNSETGYFDAILMDVQMPVMDGCEATKLIRACGRKDSDIPIVATTANAFAEDVSAVLAAGMDAHIGKPLDIVQLCATLNRLFKNNSNVRDPEDKAEKENI